MPDESDTAIISQNESKYVIYYSLDHISKPSPHFQVSLNVIIKLIMLCFQILKSSPVTQTVVTRNYAQKAKGHHRDITNGPGLGDFIAGGANPSETDYVGNLVKKSGER